MKSNLSGLLSISRSYGNNEKIKYPSKDELLTRWKWQWSGVCFIKIAKAPESVCLQHRMELFSLLTCMLKRKKGSLFNFISSVWSHLVNCASKWQSLEEQSMERKRAKRKREPKNAAFSRELWHHSSPSYETNSIGNQLVQKIESQSNVKPERQIKQVLPEPQECYGRNTPDYLSCYEPG